MKSNFRYDSNYETEYKQRIQETIEYILDKDYGKTIEFYVLSKLLHYNIDDEKENKKFKSTMARVKNFLIDYGYVLKSITGVGYYILKPKQISGYCYHTYILRTENLLNKSDRILKHIDSSQLSNIRKEEKQEVTNLNTEMINTIDTTIENSQYYKKKQKYDSLED